MDKDAFYFPHFCNARHDRKVRRVIKELGVEGYGIFFMLLEILREQQDYKYPMDDLDLLADEIGTSEQKVRVVVCNYKLFLQDEERMFFYSPKLIEYMQPYLRMKEQRRLAGKKSGEARKAKAKQVLLEESNERPFNDRSTTDERMLNEIEQRKVKESKVNINTLSSETHDIIDYLNKRTGKQYKTTTKKTRALINARIKEGFTLEDFKKVIDVKVNEWKNDKTMSKFLRPETLFGTKFEGYLNEYVEPKAIVSRYREKVYD